jgi:GNAT superfamily N-acetyltransferase
MHLVYKALVHSMPDVHLRKLQALVHQCFNAEMTTLTTLRSYDYAVLVQDAGLFIGSLFVRVSKDNEQHQVNKFCVAPKMRGQGIGAEMLAVLQSELPPTSAIVLYVDSGECHDRLVSFYERNGLCIAAQNEQETMMCSKLLTSQEAYKGGTDW